MKTFMINLWHKILCITPFEWLLICIAILLVLFIIYLLLRPFFMRRRQARQNANETAKQQKDLRAWENIAEMATDKSTGEVTKQSLSSKIKAIKKLFADGLKVIRKSGRNSASIPWFVLLGEPRSGKSSLVKESDIEFKCSTDEIRGGESLPIRFWFGKALVLDVGGQVFFDRWANGSCAEFTQIQKLIVKKHHKVPVNGIILAVPADALIADSEEMTKRKVSLIASELNSFTCRLGMKLPCYLVVTKMDMILGFQEFFHALEANQYEHVWGWRNPSDSGIFELQSFMNYWNNLQAKLHDGVYPMMLEKAPGTDEEESRLATNSGVYMFPNEFVRIQQNLLIYLNNLFGVRSWMDNDYVKVTGVYFTSAKCSHYKLSLNLAKMQDKPADEAILVSKKNIPPHSFFIKSLFEDLIFRDKNYYRFTAGSTFRRNIWRYLLCILIASLALWFGLAAFSDHGGISLIFQQKSVLYAKITERSYDGTISKSPLVVRSQETGKIEVAQKEMLAQNNNVGRLIFYFGVERGSQRKFDMPSGFLLSQLMLFQDLDFGRDKQDFVFSRIQMAMVFKPLFKLFLEHVSSSEAQKEPFTINKRNAYEQMCMLQSYQADMNTDEMVEKNALQVAPYLRYLIPDVPEQLVALLNERPHDKSDITRFDIASLIYGIDYKVASIAFTQQFITSWTTLQIYPESRYSYLRSLVENAYQVQQINEKIVALAENDKKSPEEFLPQFYSLVKEQDDLFCNIEKNINYYNLISILAPSTSEENKDLKKLMKRETIEDVFVDVDKQITNDFKLIRDFNEFSDDASGEQREITDRVTEVEQIEVAQKETEKQFSIEKENLMKKFIQLQSARYFAFALNVTDKVSTEAKDATKDATDVVQDTSYVGMVKNEILNLVAAPMLLERQKMDSPDDFVECYKQLQANLEQSRKYLTEYVKRYESNVYIADFAKKCQHVFNVQETYLKEQLLKDLFAYYPDLQEQFYSKITVKGNITPETIGMKSELAKESFGDLAFVNYYDPDVVMSYIRPIQFLCETKQDDKAPQIVPTHLKPNLKNITDMLSLYCDQYISYWASYTDKIPVNFTTWEQFHSESLKIKAYQTNTLLLASYIRCLEIITQLPDQILSETTKAKKKLAITQLNNRIQILSPVFAQACAKTCVSWGTLPDAPDKAFGVLHGIPIKQLNTDYMLIYDAGAKGDIPWWSNYVKRGMSLLFNAARKQLIAEFEYYRPMLFSFPLCRKAPYKEILSTTELQDVSQYLSSLGCSLPKGDKQDDAAGEAATTGADQKTTDATQKKDEKQLSQVPDETSSSEALEKLFGSDFLYMQEWKTWGSQIQVLLDSMINKIKPLTYTLSIPSAAQQRNLSVLMNNPLPLASYRFPYMRVFNTREDDVYTEHYLDGNDVPNLLSGLASSNMLKFQFSSFSSFSKIESSAIFDCEWAVLQFYLSDTACMDPKTKTVYSALTLQDKTGKSYVLWVGFKFNKQLPLPSEWPSAENCPDFSRLQNNLNREPLTTQRWTTELLQASEGNPGYEHLRTLIRRHPATEFPTCTASVDPQMFKKLLETPYFEISSPAETTRVFLSKDKNRIPLSLMAQQLNIRLYQYSNSVIPAYSITIDGPYALLRLMTASGRKFDKDHVIIPVNLLSNDGKKYLTVNLLIQFTPPK